MKFVDFTAYANPNMAVACPICGARAGVFCKRPSAHRAMGFHLERRQEADRVFIAQHGETAWIEDLGGGGWQIHPTGYGHGENAQAEVRSKQVSKSRAQKASTVPKPVQLGFDL